MGTINNLPIQTVESQLTGENIKQSLTFADDLRKLKSPSEINEAVTQVENGSISATVERGAAEYLKPPSEDFMDLPIKIFKSGNQFLTDFDVKAWEPISYDAVYYVSKSRGLDTNDGLSINSPVKTLNAAADLVNAASGKDFKIIVFDGYFTVTEGWFGVQIGSKNVVVDAIGDVVSSSEFDGLTWADQGGGVFYVSRNGVPVVYDKLNLTSDGDWTQLIPVDTLADCQSTSGSVFISGSDVYVHRSDGLEPNLANSMIAAVSPNVIAPNDGVMVIKGLKMYGSTSAIKSDADTQNTALIMSNCKSGYARDNAAFIKGTKITIVHNHTAVGGGNDGLNYNEGALTTEQLAIEINCTSRGFGLYASDTENNASTVHDFGKIVRVNGDYSSSRGPVINDVENALIWCVNCISGGSEGVTGIVSAAFANAGNAKTWLDSCVSRNVDDFDAVSLNTSNIYIRNCPTIANTNGNISTY